VSRLEYQFTLDGQTWTLDYHSIAMDEWVALERATGQHWAALAAGIDARSASGILAFFWLTRRRETPGLGYNSPEMKFRPAELTFDVLADEEGEQGAGPPISGASPTNASAVRT
jgi:hypothetical protein